MKQGFLRVLTGATLLAFLLAATLPVSAFADGVTPPPPTEEPTAPDDGETPLAGDAGSAEETTLPEEPVVEESVVEDVNVEESVVEEVIAEEPVIEEPLVEDPVALLTELPEGTELVVLDEQGEALSLASENAADVIAVGDPIWCPATVVMPVSGLSGCSPSQTSFAALITWLENNPQSVAGTIWIEKTFDSGAAGADFGVTVFTLDGADNLLSMSNFVLTVKGGWNGLTTNTVSQGDYSEFNARLEILNWNANITLSDILITGVTGVSSDSALSVTTTKDIILTRVEVNNNPLNGAEIDNAALGIGTGNVTITAGIFNQNTGTGLTINSNGSVTLSGLAQTNTIAGAVIDNASGVKDVVVSGIFTGNTGGDGLNIDTKGSVTLANVMASTNGGTGASINNSGATTPQAVTITTGYSQFNNNAGGGLEILSKGAIMVKDVTAIGNGANGVLIDNHLALANQAVSVTFTANQQINSNSFQFSGNTFNGLEIITRGAVTLKDITARDNFDNGVSIDNHFASPAATVTFTGLNIFYGNAQDGLVVTSLGTISASNVNALGNGSYGAELNNVTLGTAYPVTLTGTNQFKYNGSGLSVLSRGVITLNNINASFNDTAGGASLSNLSSTLGAGITLTGINVFNNNAESGIDISSRGIISLAKVSANFNGTGAVSGFGAHLDNSNALTAMAINLTIANSFSDNLEYGLFAESRGAITIALLTADRNGGNGAGINNKDSGTAVPQNVTFTGASSMQENDGTGLVIDTYGSILLGGVTANGNNAAGALINNSTGLPTAPRAVTLNGNNSFIYNAFQGIQVDSLGAITLNNVWADINGQFGAWLNNSSTFTAAAVTVTGTSEFNENGGFGLNIQSKGNIIVYNFDADENTGYGTQLANNYGSSTGSISIITTQLNWCNTFGENTGRGLTINSFGIVNLSNVCSYLNNGEGVRIDNSLATLPKSVSISGTYNSHEENDETGLVVLSKGAITINNLYASGDGWLDGTDTQDGMGVYLNNRSSGTTAGQAVSLTGTNGFFDNFYSGLEVYSYGTITLANVSADNNGYGEVDDLDKRGFGTLLDNQTLLSSTSPKAITLTGTNTFTGNWDGGLQVLGSGPISANNLEASFNNGTGASFTNDFSGSAFTAAKGGLTINGYARFSDNADAGVDALMYGAITLANLTSNDNGGFGALLNNQLLAISLGNVSMTGTTNANRNGSIGLFVMSGGSISASNLHVYDNDGAGANLDNLGLGIGSISLTGTLRFNGNNGDGLIANSAKAMSFVSLSSVGNLGGNGASLYSEISITLSGTNNFSGNGYIGLEIQQSPASVTLSNVTAIYNGEEGVYVDNRSVPTKGFTLTGANIFSYNGWDGLSVQTLGAIKINNIIASANGGSGAYLDNLHPYDIHNGITLTGTNTFNENTGPYSGLDMYSHGTITVNNVTANGNNGGGATAWNWSYTGNPVNVSFTGINTFNDNLGGVDQGLGLFIKTEGAITLNNVTANGNEQNGVYLNNYDWSWTHPVITIAGTNEFSQNGLNGIYAISDGNISMTKVTAEQNTQTGVSLDTSGNVTLTCANLNLNHDRGWQTSMQDGDSSITLIGVLAMGNDDGPSLLIGGAVLIEARSCTLP